MTTCRVLLVDDDDLVLEALQRVLHARRPDWTIVPATSGDAALAALDESNPDVAIVDYRMPRMNGLDLAEAIRAKRPSICCIMLTGHAELEAAMKALNDGNVFRFFQKPCPIDQLIAGIEAGMTQKDQARDTAKTFDRLTFGIVLVDRDGRVLRQNIWAARLLLGTGSPSIDAAGRLQGASPEESAALRRAIQCALEGTAAVMLPLQRAEGRPLAAAVCSINPKDGVAAMFLTDPETPPSPSPASVATLYGLTPAEGRLVAALARGFTVEEAAGQLGITIASARTYLRTVFSKMGVARQAELVRQVLGSAAAAMAT